MANADPTLYRFHPFSQPVGFTDCSELVDLITARLAGWQVTPWRIDETSDERVPAPIIRVAKHGAKYAITSDHLREEETYNTKAHITCAFLVELITAINAEMTTSLYLHAGAVEIYGRLIVFPARGKTGKSTLTVQMARAGARIYTDDVLPIDLATGHGWSMGIEPHIRLPMPDMIADDTHRWIEARQVIANNRMAYIGLNRDGPGSLAPFGENCPIGAFVQLNRADDAIPGLSPCPRADIMQQMIRQHFKDDIPSTEIIARFKNLVETTPCWRLNYTGGEQAVDLMFKLAEAA